MLFVCVFTSRAETAERAMHLACRTSTVVYALATAARPAITVAASAATSWDREGAAMKALDCNQLTS